MAGNLDSEGIPLSGGQNYTVTLGKNVPAKLFWSMTLYDAGRSSGLWTLQGVSPVGGELL